MSYRYVPYWAVLTGVALVAVPTVTGAQQAPATVDPATVENAGPVAENPESAEAAPQTEEAPAAGGLEEVVVTARKRSKAELSQDVPISIAAVSGEQLENRQTTSLTQLAQSVPNVAMDDGGTIKGTANFSVRGLGLASSIPTLEPTTGTFIDGMYLASNQGVILDLFDIDGIEILRGPQGTLFGRNVTGGAVLIRTRAPTDHFEAKLKTSIETGLETKIAGSVSGPLSNTIAGRLSVYYNKDDGYFTNDFDGSQFGESETTLVRAAGSWKPSNRFDTVLRVESGVLKGDGAASQNPAFQDREGFRINQDYRGFTDLNWEQVTDESNYSVDFGDGVITNVIGYRNVDDISGVDADGTPIVGFHDIFDVQVEQSSNELRYAGRFFDRLDLTTGLYLFKSTIDLFEVRTLQSSPGVAAPPRGFGGQQSHKAWAVFTQGDYEITDTVDVTLGARYSVEDKSVLLARFSANTCNVATNSCVYGENLSDKWYSFTPKIGFQWEISRDAQAYTSWSKAYRAGGYNVRVTGPAQNPRFDQESTSAFEVGGKVDWFERRLRTNIAVFHNTIKDMIRDVQIPSGNNITTDTRNTADATIWGVEFEGEALLTDAIRMTAFFGYQNGEYDELRSSLTEENPPVVDAADYALELPRLAPWSYGLGLEHKANIDEMSFTSRLNFSHRDDAFANDSNIATLNDLDMLDASVTVGLHDDKLKMTLYGRNLLDEAYQGQSILLPASVQPPITSGRRGAFNNLLEGTVVGFEWSYEF